MSPSKNEIRDAVLSQVKNLGAAEHFRRSTMALQRLLQFEPFIQAKTIFAYYSCDLEFDTQALLKTVLSQNKILCLPRTDRHSRLMSARPVNNLEADLETRHYRFLEPKESLPIIPPAALDLIIVPGISFDLIGNRLGRGGGFYDRYLAQPGVKAVLAALAFECQLSPAVPTEPHDRRIDWIFTEQRTIQAGRGTR